jgi:hypothetical protein
MDQVSVVRPKVKVERPKARLDVLRQRMGALLQESPRWTGGKQRLTASQLHRRVVGYWLTLLRVSEPTQSDFHALPSSE